MAETSALPDAVLRALRELGDERVAVEASVVLPEGLLVTLTDGEQARRFALLMQLLLPAAAHPLIEVTDRRVLLRVPPGLVRVDGVC
jgi:hypothetical protein